MNAAIDRADELYRKVKGKSSLLDQSRREVTVAL